MVCVVSVSSPKFLDKGRGVSYIRGQMPAKPHRIGNQVRPLNVHLQQASAKQQYAQHSQHYVLEKRGDIPWQSARCDAGRVRKDRTWQLAPKRRFPRPEELSRECCIYKWLANLCH